MIDQEQATATEQEARDARPEADGKTLCWRCSAEYEIAAPHCPRCAAANANVQPDLAQEQVARADAIAASGQKGGAGE